jgi:hypothetical protein
MNSTTVLGQFDIDNVKESVQQIWLCYHTMQSTHKILLQVQNTQKHLKDTIFTDMLLFVILNVINARGAVCCNFITRSEATNPDYINFLKIKTENIIYSI